jgi:hypothetical protein
MQEACADDQATNDVSDSAIGDTGITDTEICDTVPKDTGTPETGSIRDGTTVDDSSATPATPCETDLDTFSYGGERCRPTFIEMVAYLDDCSNGPARTARFAGRCDGVYGVHVHWATHSYQCFYDRDSKELVGAVKYDDVPSFCDGTSDYMRAGKAPECTNLEPTVLDLQCPSNDDGGTG